MLQSLHVKNFAIIDEVEINFSDNLNILTGETGAGKSILIDSINFALGAKVSKELIRQGAEFALVELVFLTNRKEVFDLLLKNDIEKQEDQIVITRKLLTTGRSVCKLNGEIVTAQLLREISGFLLDIHGQHEHQSLLYKHVHLAMIDRFAKDEVKELKESVQTLYREYEKLNKELNDSVIDEDKRLRELAFLEYEMNEISEAKLVPGEDDKLQAEYKRLSNSAAIAETMSSVYQHIAQDENSAIDTVSRSVKSLTKIASFDKKLDNFLSQLIDIESILNDFNREVSEYMQDCTDSSRELSIVEERLNLINHLKSKYGNHIDDILTYYAQCEEKKSKYETYDEYLSNLKHKLSLQEEKLKNASEKLSMIRKEKAAVLAEKMKTALIDLNFLDVSFEICFKKTDTYTANGFDEAEFLISTNPGEPNRPLAKIASGGELSRIMLALKSVIAQKDDIDTLIFDEIDVGISGRTAQKVSEKLGILALDHQILCITHLAQIAAMADSHYLIEKQTDGKTTHTNIRKLMEKEEVIELARMTGGVKITENVLNSAREMKGLANSIKCHGKAVLNS